MAAYKAGDKAEIIECEESGRQWGGSDYTLPVGYILVVLEDSPETHTAIRFPCPFPQLKSKMLYISKKNIKPYNKNEFPQKCTCPLNTLMSAGCQCGGQ